MAMQALVMGFGGTGAHILTALKELTVLKHGRAPETIRFLLFDTIADWEPGKAVQIVGGAAEEKIAKSEDEAASLDPLAEYFQLNDFQPDLRTHVFDYLSVAGNPDAYPHLKDWLHAPWLSENVPASQLAIVIGAAQQRQIGRFAMFKNADQIINHLSPVIRDLADYARGAEINVWLIGSSAGGTGAGCLIDAAYLTRLVAGEAKLKLTGVIVMPNVYKEVRGISEGRAYSLLRELERVQEQGIPQDDRYVDLRRRELVSSKVVYDKTGQQSALVKSRLFDDLFYLGGNCPTEEARKKFFTSVASAIDPYLDESSGPSLLEKAVNENAAASAFGAARIYVPAETFTEIFAWEQVAEYLEKSAAPVKRGKQVVSLNSGSAADRADSATAKIKGLLKLFDELLNHETKSPKAQEAFARNELDAKQIVTVWYELTGGNRTPEEQTVLLAYAEPCYSLTQTERAADFREWEAKTYKENRETKGGVEENQEESKTRFAEKLEEVRRRYTNAAGGERTFEKGRRYTLELVSQRLKKKIDDLFIGELARNRAQFAQDPNAQDQGTALTRLYAEATWMLSERGPMRKIHEVLGQFVAALAKEEADRNNRYIRALQELRDSQKSGLFVRVWVEEYQQAAREEAAEYFRWYQKHMLLKDMQQLVLNVRQRLTDWERALGRLFDGLVIRERREGGEASALFTVTQIYLEDTLKRRLNRAARNRSALISFGDDPDPEMHGYQEELRSRSAHGLAGAILGNSYWEAGVTPEGAPEVSLVIDAANFPNDKSRGSRRYTAREVRDLTQDLYQYFRGRIDERLRNTDVFDYLLWAQERRGIGPEEIAKLLNAEAAPLINAGGAPEFRTLVYLEPAEANKANLADAIAGRLQPVSIERAYSDRNAITLIKVKKPSLDEIVDIQDCRRDYYKWRTEQLNNNDAHDKELRRAQVFHSFRQELEAWFIERYCQKKEKNVVSVPDLPPRVTRLLEDPEMAQLFAHGVATGAVEKVSGKGWLWHGPEEEVELISDEDDPEADIVKAAVAFVLRQGEGRRGGLRRITREDAKRSVTEAAQKQNQSRDEMLTAFTGHKLEAFLAEHAPPNLRTPLRMIFTFYCDPKTRTGLQQRMNLP